MKIEIEKLSTYWVTSKSDFERLFYYGENLGDGFVWERFYRHPLKRLDDDDANIGIVLT